MERFRGYVPVDMPFVTMQVPISKWLKNQDLLGQSNSPRRWMFWKGLWHLASAAGVMGPERTGARSILKGFRISAQGFPTLGNRRLPWISTQNGLRTEEQPDQDATLAGLITRGLTLLPRVRKPWAIRRNPVGIDLACSDGIHFPSFRCPGRRRWKGTVPPTSASWRSITWSAVPRQQSAALDRG